MLKTLLLTLSLLLSLTLSPAVDYTAKATEHSLAISGKGDGLTFVVRPAGTKPANEDPGEEGMLTGWQRQSGTGEFFGLAAGSTYFLDAYKDGKLKSTQKVFTLAEPPAKPAGAIIFAGNFLNRIDVGLNPQDAENTLIMVQKGGGEIKLTTFNAEEMRKILADPNFRPGFNVPQAKIGTDTYIVHAGPYKAPNTVQVSVPGFDEYTFAVIGYNGDGYHANFNLMPTSNNSRSKFPMMPPPIAVDPTERNYEDGYFMAKWKKLPVPATYILSVATDPAFENVLADYNDTDFGDLDQAPVMIEDNQRLYYRVRAVAGRAKSDWSNTVVVDVE